MCLISKWKVSVSSVTHQKIDVSLCRLEERRFCRQFSGLLASFSFERKFSCWTNISARRYQPPPPVHSTHRRIPHRAGYLLHNIRGSFRLIRRQRSILRPPTQLYPIGSLRRKHEQSPIGTRIAYLCSEPIILTSDTDHTSHLPTHPINNK